MVFDTFRWRERNGGHGWIELVERYPTSYERRAVHGRRDGNRYRSARFPRSDSFSQILTTLGWTPPPTRRATAESQRGPGQGGSRTPPEARAR